MVEYSAAHIETMLRETDGKKRQAMIQDFGAKGVTDARKPGSIRRFWA